MGQPGRQPARLHRGDLRPAAERRRHPGAVVGGGADRRRGGHPARHGAARPGRSAGRADRRARHGAAARAVRRPAVLPADRAQHPAVPRLGDLRAGDDRDRGPYPDPGPAQVGLRPHRGAGHRPADDPTAGRDPGTAQVRDQRGTGRALLPAGAAGQASAAGVRARHLDRLLGGDRHRGRGRGLVRAADRRLQPALAQPAGRLRRNAGRVQRHSGAVLCHRAARAGHGRARQPEGHLRRVHRAARRRARLRRAGGQGTRPGVRQRVFDGGVGAEPAPAVGPPDPGRFDRRPRHGGRAVAEHRRLRELPRPHRLGVRADVGRPDRGLLRRVGSPVGLVSGRQVPLADAAPLGRGLRHLPARQSRLRLLVGLGLVVVRAAHRVHPAELDVGVDPVFRRRRADNPAGRLARPAGLPGVRPGSRNQGVPRVRREGASDQG